MIVNSTLNLILFATILYPERSGAELQSGLGHPVRTGVQNSFERKVFSVGVKRSALPLCYTGMETELESAEVMRSEDSLAKRLADGDLGAPRELVERHHAELCRYAWALLRDATAAEDAVQSAFERAFVALGKYPEERIAALSLRPWLYRIVLNVVRNVWRKSRREVSVAETPEPDESLGGVSGSPFDADREAWLDTIGALGQLPERQRIAVALRYVEDLPYAEIAATTGWPENTCKTLVRRGIARLTILLSSTSDRNGGR
jgi:RNA polymerase sigma-70 factor (ECF subfamily)